MYKIICYPLTDSFDYDTIAESDNIEELKNIFLNVVQQNLEENKDCFECYDKYKIMIEIAKDLSLNEILERQEELLGAKDYEYSIVQDYY